MPYKKSNKQIQDAAFKLRSGNTTPFKQMGSSPLKQDYVKDIYHEKYNPSGKIGKPKKIGTISDVSKEITRVAKGGKPQAELIKKAKVKPPSKLPPYSTAKKELAKKISAKNIKVNLATAKKELAKKISAKNIKVGKSLLGKVGKFLGGKALATAGMYLGSMKTAKATQPGTGKHGGKKVKKYNPETGKYE
jgi:hypothetical protein